MTTKITREIRRYTNWRAWVRGLVKAAVEGGSTAALATLGSLGTDVVGLAGALNWQQALTVGVSGAFVSMLVFLKAQPLPEESGLSRPPMEGVS